MTALMKTERGVEEKVEGRCIDCPCFEIFGHNERGRIGVCDNEKSEHHKHVVSWDHPRCEDK